MYDGRKADDEILEAERKMLDVGRKIRARPNGCRPQDIGCRPQDACQTAKYWRLAARQAARCMLDRRSTWAAQAVCWMQVAGRWLLDVGRKVHARPAECLGACGALDTGGRALVAGGRGYWVLAARCMPELMGVGRPSGTRGHG